jgi:glycosyltransferase involved in cell wall biosynthesis
MMQNAPAANSLPKVSIVMVTFNAAAFLQDSLNSIYRQTYPNLEIVVMDGASKDNTTDILKANNDKITYWKSEPDSGIYDAMNKALQHITGDWVYFLGADDIMFDDFSKLAYQLKDKHTIYYGNVIMNGKKTGPVTSSYSLAKKNICHQAIFYPVSVFKKYSFEKRYVTDADHLMNMQLWTDKNYHFQYIDTTIADFGDSGASSTRTDVEFERDRPQLVLKYFGAWAWARYVLRVYKAAKRAKRNQGK